MVELYLFGFRTVGGGVAWFIAIAPFNDYASLAGGFAIGDDSSGYWAILGGWFVGGDIFWYIGLISATGFVIVSIFDYF